MTSNESLVVVTIKIKASPGKKKELLQTFDELRSIVSREEGCRQVDISQSKLDTDMVIVSETWANTRDALRHFQSDHFYVLTGATSVLAQSLKMTISIELQTTSVDLENLESRKEVYHWAEKTLSEIKI